MAFLGSSIPSTLAVNEDQVCAFSPHYEPLLTIQVEHVTFPSGAGGGREKVRTAAWFG